MPLRSWDAVAEIHLDGRDADERASRHGGEATHGVVEHKEVDDDHRGVEKS